MEHDFSSGTAANITVGATTTVALAAVSGRKYAILVNDSNETIYLSLGTDAVLNKGIRLNANGGAYEILGKTPYRGAVNAICSSGSKNLCVFYA